ncbi:MAG TPA: hypothetical protein VML55_23330 [Planctomycetaceae bacterium]|nr:hypothetical protein [Planctomycetaceae bacterium]
MARSARHNLHDSRRQPGTLGLRSGFRRGRRQPLPAAAYRERISRIHKTESFGPPEVWHEPQGRVQIAYVVEPPGRGYRHAVTVDEVRARLALLPRQFTRQVDILQFSRMTRKRALFPCYGMQWGSTIYLYPIEDSLVEVYSEPPTPAQRIEACMYGGRWERDGRSWQLVWTPETIRDFYLNNVLIHELGHIVDDRNTSFEARERYANWFAIEYGYRASRGRR